MENGFNRDKELITEKVEENKYELNRNAPTIDSYTNEEFVNVTPYTPIGAKETEYSSTKSDSDISQSTTALDQKVNQKNYLEEYSQEVAPNIIDFNRSYNKPSNEELSDYHSEYASEVAPSSLDFNRREDKSASIDEEDVDDVSSGRGVGGLALALSVLSLFVLPVVLGAIGIIIGFIARRRGATKLGTWAIGIGAISIIVGMFILPFFS